MRNTDEITISREEYDRLIEDSRDLEKIYKQIEKKSYMDVDGNFCINDIEILNILQILRQDAIDEIEQEKREEYNKMIEEASKIAKEEIEKNQDLEQKEQKIIGEDDEY